MMTKNSTYTYGEKGSFSFFHYDIAGAFLFPIPPLLPAIQYGILVDVVHTQLMYSFLVSPLLHHSKAPLHSLETRLGDQV